MRTAELDPASGVAMIEKQQRTFADRFEAEAVVTRGSDLRGRVSYVL